MDHGRGWRDLCNVSSNPDSRELLRSTERLTITSYRLDALQVGKSNRTTFQLEDADDGPVYFFGWTKATDVQMNVTLQAPPPSSTTLSASFADYNVHEWLTRNYGKCCCKNGSDAQLGMADSHNSSSSGMRHQSFSYDGSYSIEGH